MTEARDSSRLRWRCRRGMKELDLLLLRYLERDYPTAPGVDRDVFERIIELQDPELFGYLVTGNVPADPSLQHVIARIRHAP